MATVLTNMEQSKVISNLDTYNYTVKVAGVHTVTCSINQTPVSAIIIVIKQNSTTIGSVPSPAASQSYETLTVKINCAIGDVIGIIVSSSLAQDNAINDFKGIINIRTGTI